MPPKIDIELCTGCNICVDICPMDVLKEGERVPVVAYPDECWHCGACVMDCPKKAVRLVLPLPMRPVAIRIKGK
jgi:adenylylsulfate reductase subunit B